MTISPYQESAALITEHITEYAQQIFDTQMQRNISMMKAYGPYQKQKCLQDTYYNLQYLAETLTLNSDKLWEDYIVWLKTLLISLKVKTADTAEHFRILLEVLKPSLPASDLPQVQNLIEIAVQHFSREHVPEFEGLSAANPRAKEARQYIKLLLSAQKNKATEFILDLATDAQAIRDIYLNILQPVQREIGMLWHTNKISVAQEHYSTGVTQLVISLMYPRLFDASPKNYSLVATCVSGELHEIGLRMVTDIMEIDGWDTTFLGANMPNQGILETIIKQKTDLVAISVTFPLNLHKAESLIDMIKSNSQAAQTKIMVGGYPFLTDEALWQKIGADAYAKDASLANAIARKLMEKTA